VTPLLAHAGHWLVQLVYAVPLIFMLGLFGLSYIRRRREEGPEGQRSDIRIGERI
jgi:hypothetical protein